MAKRKGAPKPAPPPDERRCTELLRICRKCQRKFRAVKDARVRNCPKCGEDRRCVNYRLPPHNVCAAHVKEEARQPEHAKFYITRHLWRAYNRIVKDPNLLRLSQELAVIASRTDQLFRMMEANDPSVAHGRIMEAVQVVEQGIMDDEPKTAYIGLDMLRKAIDPVRLEWALWSEIKENFELTRRLSDTERHYILMDQEAIPVAQVIEALVFVQRLTLKYIPNPADRAAFARELRQAMSVQQPEAALVIDQPPRPAAA